MMKSTILKISVAVIALSGLVTGCTKSDNPAEQRAAHLAASKGPVVVVAASPWAEKRNELRNGLELACNQINDAGGIMNRQLVLRYIDDLNDEATGQVAAYTIASDPDVCAVIGHSSSSVSTPNALLYHYYGILMFSPLSTAGSLTEQGFNKVFRNIPNDELFGQEAAMLCAKMNWRKVMVYYSLDEYGESLANAFERQCTLLSVDVLDRSGYSQSEHRSRFKETAELWERNYAFDAVFVAGTLPLAGEIISVLRENGISCPVIGGEAFDQPALLALDEKVSNNVYVISMYDQESRHPAFVKFSKEFNEAYGYEPDQAALQGYDALHLFADSCNKAESIVPDVVADFMHRRDIWEGAAGPYSFTASGDITGKRAIFKKVVNRQFLVLNEEWTAK